MGTSTLCVVFDLFHKERHKADVTKCSLVPFVHDGYTGVFTYIFCKFLKKKNFIIKIGYFHRAILLSLKPYSKLTF